jgi:hypothetical protein
LSDEFCAAGIPERGKIGDYMGADGDGDGTGCAMIGFGYCLGNIPVDFTAVPLLSVSDTAPVFGSTSDLHPIAKSL